jgi:Co/Zn/Cd efflux system component
LDQKFQGFIKQQKKLAYEQSQQMKAIKNLQNALNERKMSKDLKDPKLWTTTKTLADIALHFAI